MFTRRFAASMVGTTLTAATLGLAALGFAGTASASSTDEAFLAQLQADPWRAGVRRLYADGRPADGIARRVAVGEHSKGLPGLRLWQSTCGGAEKLPGREWLRRPNFGLGFLAAGSH